jgi:hypothetical protein
MVDELRALPGPDGTGTLFDAIDLVVPHQANQTMVTKLAQEVGLDPARLYFDIKRVGNTSSASIPIAIHDAVREGAIDSLTDCSSMNAMDAQGIREVLTNDHHFEQDGYVVLIRR